MNEKKQLTPAAEKYSAPEIEVIDIEIEQTFLQTGSGGEGGLDPSLPGSDL